MSTKCYWCNEYDVDVTPFQGLTICMYCKDLFDEDQKEDKLSEGNDSTIDERPCLLASGRLPDSTG